MPSEKQVYEGVGVPVRTFVVAAGSAFACLFIGLAIVFGLYTLWVNGPQAPVRPAPLANATAPSLETGLFRPRPTLPDPADPRVAAAQGYRWRDGGHNRVEVPIDRAMAMTAERGDKASSAVDGAVGPTEVGR